MSKRHKYLSILMNIADRLNKSGLIRYYVYFRIGHTNYFAFFMSLLNFLTLQYFLLIRNVPILKELFPNFLLFSAVFLLVYVPTSIIVGWLDLRKLATKKVQQVGPFVKKPMIKEYLWGLGIGLNFPFLVMLRLLLDNAKLSDEEKEKLLKWLRVVAENTIEYYTGKEFDTLTRPKESCEVLKDLGLIDERGFEECIKALRKSYYRVWEKEI